MKKKAKKVRRRKSQHPPRNVALSKVASRGVIEIPNVVSLARFDRLWNDLKAEFGADIFDESCRHACRMIDELLTVRESILKTEQAENLRTSKLLLHEATIAKFPVVSVDERKYQVVICSIYDALLQDVLRLQKTHPEICTRIIKRYVSGIRDARSQKQQEGAKDRQRGIRFELSVAQDLAGHGYKFSNPDSPDFLLGGKYKGIAIECTSRLLSSPDVSELSIQKAIRTCIEKKQEKPYAGDSLALFVDFTNIGSIVLHKSLGSNAIEAYRNEAQDALREYGKKIGAIVLFHYRNEVKEDEFFRCKNFTVFEDVIMSLHCSRLLQDFLGDYKTKNTLLDNDTVRRTRQQDFAR